MPMQLHDNITDAINPHSDWWHDSDITFC